MNEGFRPVGAVLEGAYSALGDRPYEQILSQVQQGVSQSLDQKAEDISDADLKDKIRRYVTDNRITCSLTDDVSTLVNHIYHDMAGYSFITRESLFDLPGFEEIDINAWNDVDIVVKGLRKKTAYTFLSPQHAVDIHTRMLRKTNTLLNEATPRATADIGDGIRITVLKTPILDADVAVASSIRKVSMSVVSPQTLLENKSLTLEMLDFLLLALRCGIPVCISGETGAGKTTLAGCLLNQLSLEKRIYSIEEGSREWNFVHKDETGKITTSVIHTRTRPNEDNKALHIGQEELVRDSLRFDPDVIAPGEIRGREAFEIMGVANTGHTVVTTIHSNGTADTPERIVTLAKKAFDMSDSTLYKMACRAFPVLIHMESGPDRRRRVTEIREVTGYAMGEVQSTMLYEFDVEDNIYEGDRCVRTVGDFKRLSPISEGIRKRMLKKGATRAQLAPFVGVLPKHEGG